MSRDYRELVGLQAKFDNAVARYRLIHYYRWRRVREPEDVQVMTGYDMERHDTVEFIAGALRHAYAPAVLSTWKNDTTLNTNEYLQFGVSARPDEIGLGGDWKLVDKE